MYAVFDLPSERFSAFELTDESEGECLDRAAVVPGEIRVADRAYLQPDRIAQNGAWRLLRLPAAALYSAIAPPPPLHTIRAAAQRLRRHFHEPPQRRAFQKIPMLC